MGDGHPPRLCLSAGRVSSQQPHCSVSQRFPRAPGLARAGLVSGPSCALHGDVAELLGAGQLAEDSPRWRKAVTLFMEMCSLGCEAEPGDRGQCGARSLSS